MLAHHAFCLECGLDFLAGITGVPLVHNVAERDKIIVSLRAVHSIIDSDKANAFLTQDFQNLTDFQIITPQTAHILHHNALHIFGFDFFHHREEAGAVKTGAGNAIVRKVGGVRQSMTDSVFFEQLLLVRYGVALAL